ncbi:E3 SUMO-protein ligase KIAA1586-like [Aphis craccivora]|uniref:E3 SUMO-protein ligase KIAA1586-like n=1 Tax=Aphis craccivora TaxID=307492 RepID=A0A6G0Y355_APHCR|nr:E3 SUMO-protein ligase KIAA1586-like [Aphis craccivora]
MNKRQQSSISDFFNKKKKNDQDINDNQYNEHNEHNVDDPDIPKTAVNNEDTTAVNNSLCQPIEFIRDDDTPECWDSKQVKYFCQEYPWLYFKNKKLGCNICHNVNLSLNKNQVLHVHVSSNWTQCEIIPSGDS